MTSGGENRRLFLPSGTWSAEHIGMRGGGPGEIRDDTYETASEVRLIICRQPAITNPRAADRFLKLLCWSNAGDVARARSGS